MSDEVVTYRPSSRAKHAYSEIDANKVFMLASKGATQSAIATHLGISTYMLKKLYDEPWKAGLSLVNHQVANRILDIALNSDSDRTALEAAKFWISSREPDWDVNHSEETEVTVSADERKRTLERILREKSQSLSAPEGDQSQAVTQPAREPGIAAPQESVPDPETDTEWLDD